ncbi:hypothetical protein C7B67_22115 [filamentous cyanobacterium Phorm 6]|nr:hypothetical protein C7B67_22115 [filamentous cyanobacterium Phorm 6]
MLRKNSSNLVSRKRLKSSNKPIFYKSSVISHYWSLVIIGHWSLVVSHWFLVTGERSSVISCY